MKKIGVIGAGTWGIAISQMLSDCYDVIVWSAIEEEIDNLNEKRIHPNLPEIRLSSSIEFTKDLEYVCNAQYLVIAVPSVFMRSTIKKVRKFVTNDKIIISLTKGLEETTCYTMSELIKEEIGDVCSNIVVLSGPTHAEEVIKGLPSTIVAACEKHDKALIVQNIFTNKNMRVYTNPDVIGVEICGAVKNIIAIAAGVADGLGYGDNAKAAIITRGCAEIRRLGTAMGCMRQTFNGLAGIGDLIVTSTSKHSRNNKAGYLIGKGMTVSDALNSVGMVVEGVNAIKPVYELSKRYEIEMPIVNAMNDVIFNGIPAVEVSNRIFSRENKSEIEYENYDISFETFLRNSEEKRKMKRVITYGTFDLLHYGHINLLKRAKALGDYLVVVVSTDEFNWNEKQKKCYFSYEERKMLLESIRYVDLVIPENNWEQKKSDVHEYHIDTFVMGDDWRGKFDFLKEEGVEVVYLPRTPEISTTQIKMDLNQN